MAGSTTIQRNPTERVQTFTRDSRRGKTSRSKLASASYSQPERRTSRGSPNAQSVSAHRRRKFFSYAVRDATATTSPRASLTIARPYAGRLLALLCVLADKTHSIERPVVITREFVIELTSGTRAHFSAIRVVVSRASTGVIDSPCSGTTLNRVRAISNPYAVKI